jgi:hypothetical protein
VRAAQELSEERMIPANGLSSIMPDTSYSRGLEESQN